MKTTAVPLREAIAAMMELLASQRPDLLPAYLDLASNSPAKFAVLELASEQVEANGVGVMSEAAFRLSVGRGQDLLEQRGGVRAAPGGTEGDREGDLRAQVAGPQPDGYLSICDRLESEPGLASLRRAQKARPEGLRLAFEGRIE